jgi:hypothetical protein
MRSNPLLPEEILDGGFTALTNMACTLKKVADLNDVYVL